MNDKPKRTYTCKIYVCDNVVERWGALCPQHQKQLSYIPDGGMNEVIKDWQSKRPDREQSVASPSTLTECPRVVWLKKNKVPYTNEMGWGKKQRNMLGRIAENLFASQLRDEGKLLWHWKDDVVGESVKFEWPNADGSTLFSGTPDLLINLNGQVLISDAKTSRADSFAYVPINDDVWKDELWYKYKLQVEAYYLLCHKNKDWFSEAVATGGIVTDLPLPEACHLFSYALDDGVVKREYTWKPTQATAAEIIHYATRWNKAYNSEEIPDCQCTETQRKFCSYGDPNTQETTRSGYKLMTECCNVTG